mmetsp:Transcript_30991/g.43142  ORF Transcript_30991/g.43142 Transcript_30991/m.43142 type:complete len:106 (-) Transcript_30991:81-398(-)
MTFSTTHGTLINLKLHFLLSYCFPKKLFKVATYLLKNPQSSKPAELKKHLVDFDRACDEMLYTLDANQELLYRSMSDLNQQYTQHSVCQETLKSINSILSPGFQS